MKETLKEHNENFEKAKNGNVKDSFGKTVFPVKFDLDKPIYVAQITPAIHYTMGGLKIDRNVSIYNNVYSSFIIVLSFVSFNAYYNLFYVPVYYHLPLYISIYIYSLCSCFAF